MGRPRRVPSVTGRTSTCFFQDFGLLAYGPDGKELWRMPLGPFNNPFGHGASPILAGDTLLMNVDQDTGSYCSCGEKSSGRVLWRSERPFAQRGYATPVLYRDPGGTLQVLVAGSYRLSGYDVQSGKEILVDTAFALADQTDAGGVRSRGSSSSRIRASPTGCPGEGAAVRRGARHADLNKDGRLSKDELTDPSAKNRFDEYLDLDHTDTSSSGTGNSIRSAVSERMACARIGWAAQRCDRDSSPVEARPAHYPTFPLRWRTAACCTR